MERVREWAETLNRSRKDEALASLRDEGVVVESVFLDSTAEGDYLVYFMKAKDLKKSREAVEKSHSIDKYHQQFKRDAWEEQKQLELLVDLDRIGEAT